MKKSFIIIFIVNMVLRIIMQGLLPLYPIITESLGASKQQNGFILALSYAMLLISTLICGKLVPKYTNAKTLLIVSIIPMCLGMSLIGFAHDITSFIAYSLLLFFFAGVNIIAGIMLISYFSTSNSAGENFGIIGLSSLLGSLLGGFIVGPLLQHFGYQTSFLIFALFLFITCLFTFWVEKPIIPIKEVKTEKFILTKKFALVLLSFVLAVMLIHVFLFSFSLSMKASGFNISSISIYSKIHVDNCLCFNDCCIVLSAFTKIDHYNFVSNRFNEHIIIFWQSNNYCISFSLV
jgi:MFS family permease